MATATAAAAVIKTRKAGAPTPTPADFINSNVTEDNSTYLRLQFLTARIGLTTARAPLIAALVWGGGNG